MGSIPLVHVMKEAGVDISAQVSKTIDAVLDVDFDYVITVCENARENCPVFPGRTSIFHREFEDPPRLAADLKTEEEALGHYRRVRDEIRAFVEGFPENLG